MLTIIRNHSTYSTKDLQALLNALAESWTEWKDRDLNVELGELKGARLNSGDFVYNGTTSKIRAVQMYEDKDPVSDYPIYIRIKPLDKCIALTPMERLNAQATQCAPKRLVVDVIHAIWESTFSWSVRWESYKDECERVVDQHPVRMMKNSAVDVKMQEQKWKARKKRHDLEERLTSVMATYRWLVRSTEKYVAQAHQLNQQLTLHGDQPIVEIVEEGQPVLADKLEALAALVRASQLPVHWVKPDGSEDQEEDEEDE
jgi:hypothetical protein